MCFAVPVNILKEIAPGIYQEKLLEIRASFRFTGTQKGKEEPKEKINNTKKKKTEIYRMKEVVFKKEGKDFIIYQKDQELSMYIGVKPFKEAQRLFEQLKFPKWSLAKQLRVITLMFQESKFLTTSLVNADSKVIC